MMRRRYSVGHYAEAWSGSGGLRQPGYDSRVKLAKGSFSSHRPQVDGSRDHKISVQRLAVDFLKKGSVDWRGGVGLT